MAAPPRLLAISSGATGLDWLDELIADGVDAVQLREKHLPDGELLRLAARWVAHARGRLAVLVNGRADVAQAAGADGVHLPARGAPTAAVRRGFPRLLVGRSTHDAGEVHAAAADGADYVTFGPVLPTPSKARYGPAQGFEALRAAVRAAGTLPVLALGGIGPGDVAAAFATGVHGIAGIRAFADAASRQALVRACAGLGSPP